MSNSVLWAKKSKKGEHTWLPLDVHLLDTAEVAERLWDKWLPESVRKTVTSSVGGNEQQAKKLFTFLAAAHDIGKATPVFQAKLSGFPANDLDLDIYDRLLAAGLCVRESREKYAFYGQTPHALASQLLLENAVELKLSDTNLCKNAAIILGSHHGKPPDTGYDEILYAYSSNFGIDYEVWRSAQSELIQLALQCAGYGSLADVPCPTMPGQALLSGLLIMADWIASNDGKFPLLPWDCSLKIDFTERAQLGWEKLDLPGAWNPCITRSDEGLYADRFGYKPRDVQKAALLAVNSLHEPGIMVIEAPMGSGKTEAALVVAEVFRDRAGSGGLFFALPTQATSDGIFPRLLKWIEKLDLGEKHSIKLAHGKAQFNNDYNKLFAGSADVSDDEEEGHAAFVHPWFNGRKKSLLADFVAGTIDQLLLMALKQKHVMLRHLGLAGKVVIIDECHAYDAYMSQYLKMALYWLGAYKVPVIVLSATLPCDKRREVIGAYLGNEKLTGDWAQSIAYPLITYTDGSEVKYRAVTLNGEDRAIAIDYLVVEEVADKLEDLLSGGGCAGVIMDTVRRAQDMARVLRDRFGAENVRLVHSRFIATDRIAKEGELRAVLGKDGNRPKNTEKLIVVGTQVLEQSLDIDFDVMITDIAPMDLLLQRLGRLHRHERMRPEKLCRPACYVTGIDGEQFESGIDVVYHKYLLMRTKALLDDLDGAVFLPRDIARLVNAAYDRDAEWCEEKENWEKELREKQDKADCFKMGKPLKKLNKTIENWLNADVKDDSPGKRDASKNRDVESKRGTAAVRDSYDSVEVIVIKESTGEILFVDGKTKLPKTEIDDELALRLARQTVALPKMLSTQVTIDELEKSTKERVPFWQDSPWISGELFLILDENNTSTLCGHIVTYTEEDGLRINKE